MTMQPLPTSRFIRKTQLDSNEYRKRFRQIDDDIIAAITSPEADQITPLMSKIYLRLVNAPDNFWERQGVLRFEAVIREGKSVKAWMLLCQLLSVSSATANKALTWMHKEGIIGYFSGKNGVGLRIFLNRATSSIGLKPIPARKKILDYSPASSGEAAASRNEAAFKETYGDLDDLDLDINSCAPKDGADNKPADKISLGQSAQHSQGMQDSRMRTKAAYAHTPKNELASLDEIVRRLRRELEPALRSAAAQAAAREHERTREWLENRGLPKAARVAQREAFNLLRRQGVMKDSRPGRRSELMVGGHDHAPYKPKRLRDEEIKEVAEICVWMLEGHRQAIEVTLGKISAEAGGYLLAEDAPRVRELAEALAEWRRQNG
jgi:CRP-like cAMP-binding protein